MSSIPVVILIINLLLFAGIVYYFMVRRHEINESEKMLLEKQKLFDTEEQKTKTELQSQQELVERRSSYILSESESIANEVIEYLLNALGEQGATKVVLPIGENYELKLEQLKDTIKKHYGMRVEKLVQRLEGFKVTQAQAVGQYAEEQMESTDVNFQKMKVIELGKIQEQVETFKREEIAIFEKKVKKVVDEAALDVLGHALTRQEHEELIVKALKRAKENNGL